MAQIFVNIYGVGNKSFIPRDTCDVAQLFEKFQICHSDAYVVHQGRLVENDTVLEPGHTYHVIPRLVGGKGGFGSMLRALGAQIEKTTNREACRDLSGRRMRDVNNEQKLREWVGKAADREREKDEKRRERLERRKAEPRHQFDDQDYVRQKTQVAEGLEGALQQGLQKVTASTSAATCTVTSSRKRKSDEPGPSSSSAKKPFEWLGDGLSDLDTDSDTEEPADVGSEPIKSNTQHDSYSDSGVESITEVKIKGSPMDVDSDSSGKDSAVNIDIGLSEHQSVMDEHKQNTEHHGSMCDTAETPAPQPQPTDPATVDLMDYTRVSELEALGLHTLKELLMLRGMKCGGTLQQRAERLWAARGVPQDQIDPTLLAKPSKGKGKKR